MRGCGTTRQTTSVNIPEVLDELFLEVSDVIGGE